MMMMLSHNLLLLWIVFTVTCFATAFATKHSLCADPVTGAFVGLAADVDTYDSIAGSKSIADQLDQKWILVEETSNNKSNNNTGPINSFTGKFLQVLPDVGRSYPGRGEGRVTAVQTLLDESPYVQYQIRVEKEGWHTLFLRWTGGDMIGGGDSLYVAMLQDDNSKKAKTGGRKAMIGQRSLKPLMVPIDATATSFAGCCYDGRTHACPCLKTAPQTEEENENCPNFVPQHQAAGYGIQCPLGPGAMQFVKEPTWYLFAGQSVGNVEDFTAEPWDATCEANGSNTADSGADVASWYLSEGQTYSFVIFAREDGTAFDGFYLAGPDSDAPLIQTSFAEGDSTICTNESNKKSGGSSKLLKNSVLAISTMGLISMVLYAVTRRNNNDISLLDRARNFVSSRSSSIITTRDGLYHQMELHPDEANNDIEG